MTEFLGNGNEKGERESEVSPKGTLWIFFFLECVCGAGKSGIRKILKFILLDRNK
jgi:hypothetical protein